MRADTVTDKRALLRRRERDQAITDLYAEHQSRLVGYLRCTIPAADVEAVVQETFYRALLHYDELRHFDNPWAWLMVVARNLARNQLRDAHIGELSGLELSETALGTAAGPEEHACVADDVRRIGAAVAQLSPVQRQMLSMLLVDGVSSAEAGRRLGLRADTARQHLCRLRRRLVAAYEAGSKTLAGIPLLGLRWVRQAFRRLTDGARSPLTSSGFAIGALAGAVGMVAGVVGGFALAPSPQLRMTPQVVAMTATTRPLALEGADRGWRRVGVDARHDDSSPASPSKDGRTSASASVGGARAWVSVSHTPTKPGRSLSAGTQLETPVGEVTIPVNDTQEGSALDPVCKVVRTLCG